MNIHTWMKLKSRDWKDLSTYKEGEIIPFTTFNGGYLCFHKIMPSGSITIYGINKNSMKVTNYYSVDILGIDKMGDNGYNINWDKQITDKKLLTTLQRIANEYIKKAT